METQEGHGGLEHVFALGTYVEPGEAENRLYVS